MKILLDHNLDRRLKTDFEGHEVATVQERGWSDVLNGDLLTLAETGGFAVVVTADSNIKTQQNISGRNISILVLRSFDNRLTTHREMIADAMKALKDITPGEVVEIFHPAMPKR